MFTSNVGAVAGFGAFGYGIVIIGSRPNMRAIGVSEVLARGYNILRRWDRTDCTVLLVRKVPEKKARKVHVPFNFGFHGKRRGIGFIFGRKNFTLAEYQMFRASGLDTARIAVIGPVIIVKLVADDDC